MRLGNHATATVEQKGIVAPHRAAAPLSGLGLVLARVDEHVLAHIGPIGKCPQAVGTPEGALARVCVQVHVEVPLALEPHRTVGAG